MEKEFEIEIKTEEKSDEIGSVQLPLNFLSFGEIEPDADGAVEIHMDIPDNIGELISTYPDELQNCTETMVRGIINFTRANEDLVLTIVCTLDMSE